MFVKAARKMFGEIDPIQKMLNTITDKSKRLALCRSSTTFLEGSKDCNYLEKQFFLKFQMIDIKVYDFNLLFDNLYYYLENIAMKFAVLI